MLVLMMCSYVFMILCGEASQLPIPLTEIVGFPQNIIEGERSLTCIGIKYTNINRHVTAGQCHTMTNHVGDFYENNSRGLLQLRTAAFQVDVPLRGNKKNVGAAEQYAINQHKGADWYAIASIYTGNHASDGIAHVSGALLSTVTHEVGHLVGLGHAGAYTLKKGKMIFDQYGDHQSAMSRYSSPFLTSPQYYYLGWIPKEEMMMYQDDKSYVLKKIVSFKENGLSVILVPASSFIHHNSYIDGFIEYEGDDVSETVAEKKPSGPRNAFISFPPGCDKPCVAIHLSNGGGSQKVATFSKEYYDEFFTGLHIKVLGVTGDNIIISVDFDPKPDDFIESEDQIERNDTSDFIY